MNLPHTNHSIVVAGLLLSCTLFSFLLDTEKLKYTQEPTIAGNYDSEQTIVIAYRDTLSDDSLFLVKTQENIPLHYFKPITTEVCFSQECRLLSIIVFWNITGRYLGFELPAGEFLSKRDHEPFFHHEYERLNDLLADSNLPLGGVSFKKLLEIPETETDSVDGVTGATTPAISEMVVKGAAYTTYTLWNIVYGPTRDYVMSLTEKQLSSDLMVLILKSPAINDRVWALNRLSQKTTLTPQLTSALLDIISGDDFYQAYSAINAIKPSHLQLDSLQIGLFSIYQEATHNIKSLLVKKLMEASYLNPELTAKSRKLLPKLNGKQLGDILKLYAKHSIYDLDTLKAVAEILKRENSYISGQAYRFLNSVNISDPGIIELLDDYNQSR